MLSYCIEATIPTTSGRKKSKSFYPGTNINQMCFYAGYSFKHFTLPNKVGYKNEILNQIFETNETDEQIILKEGVLSAIVQENDFLDFEIEWKKELIFDKATKNVVNEDFFDDFKLTTSEYTSLLQVCEFISKVSAVNENVYNFFRENPDIIMNKKYSISQDILSRMQVVLQTLACSISEAEKMINAGQGKLLIKNFSNPDFKFIKNTKKLSQSIGLPPFALPMIKKLRLEECVPNLMVLNSMVDGNSFKMFMEFIDNFSGFLILNKFNGSNKERTTALDNFISNICEILNKGYKLQDTLNYVLRQRMYWNKDLNFDMPLEDTKLFLDYLNLISSADLKCEKYPQNLMKMHNILLQNLKSYNEVDDEKFKDAVALYSKFENELKKDGYVFLVPKDIKALIQEGNDLHHCIGSYVPKIIKGESKIFFMRKSTEKNTSFVTVELDDHCNIVEIKGAFNVEPEPKIISIAKKWAGICKRI